MELTKQHKVLAGIVSLGVGAVVLDRTVLNSGVTGPSVSAAATTSDSIKPGSAGPSAVVIERLADRIAQVEGRAQDQDAIAGAIVAPANWSVANVPASSASGSTRGTSLRFDQFRVSSVMTRPVAAAVVNGHMLRSGQNYAFGTAGDGKFGVLSQDELRQQRKLSVDSVSTVRLVSVIPRSDDNPGGAVIEVDGKRIELLIEQSEKD